MLALLLPLAFAVEPGTCATPEVLRALAGRGAAPFPGVLQAPPRLGNLPSPPPPGGAKVVYGTNYDDHYDTENFTLNWWDSKVTVEEAEAAGEALETAWSSFLEAQGWPPPVSSDRYLVKVLLDRSLGDTTGYTTEYSSDDYPEGYPVIYLNPDWAYDASFWSSLAAHEFMHAIQYGMRDWGGSDKEQGWYWEASATHASELADPTWDGHQYASEWYATQPGLAYDSYEGSHQYGIFVLNAWLEEAVGAGTMLRIWEESTDRSEDSWDSLIALGAELPLEEIWGGFTGAYGNQQQAESALYTPVDLAGEVSDGLAGSLALLGTDYLEASGPVRVSANGAVVLSGPTGTGESIDLATGEILAVTGLIDGADYLLVVEEIVDTGPADSGGGGSLDDTAVYRPGGGRSLYQEPGGCGCQAGPAGGALVWLLGLAAVARRRRT